MKVYWVSAVARIRRSGGITNGMTQNRAILPRAPWWRIYRRPINGNCRLSYKTGREKRHRNALCPPFWPKSFKIRRVWAMSNSYSTTVHLLRKHKRTMLPQHQNLWMKRESRPPSSASRMKGSKWWARLGRIMHVHFCSGAHGTHRYMQVPQI